MTRLFSRRILLLLVALACGPTVRGLGTVRTVDGKVYEGELRFDQDKVLVTPRRGLPVRLELATVLYAAFHAAEPARPQTPRGGDAQGQVPAQWRPQDVGAVGTPGDVRLYNGVFAVKGAGTNISEKADSFFYVPQEINGDFTLTARVAEIQQGDLHAKAGVMIRKFTGGAVDVAAANLFLFVTPREGTACFWRADSGNDTSHSLYARQPGPLWLRLVRRQNTVTAFTSIDGTNWVQFEQRDVALDQRAWLGLAVCSHNRAGTLAASFDNVAIYPGPPRDDENARRGNPAGPALNRSLMFRRGTVLANVQLQSMTGDTLKIIRPDGKPASIPSAEIARLVLANIPQAMLAKIPERGSGVLLARGDFMEGDVQAITDGRVKLSSVLFGLSNLAIGGEAAVVVLNEPQPARSTWVVRANDGSVYYAGALHIERDQLVIEDDSVGVVKVPSWNLLEVKAGEARSDPLAGMKPAKIDTSTQPAARAFVAGATSLVALSLPDTLPLTEVAMRAGVSVDYALDGNYKVFLARVGVPDGLLPSAPVRYSILVDGVETYRSPQRTSLDDPAVISVNLNGAKTLTLRVDPSPAGTSATVVWADAALMK